MKKLLKQTKKELAEALRIKKYTEAESLSRTLHTLSCIGAGKGK